MCSRVTQEHAENESGGKKKKKGDKGWVSPEAAIEAYNEQVRAEIAKVAPTAIKAYNGKAGIYEQVVQKKGQPLREGFTIVKVRGTCASLTHAHLPLSPNCEATASQLGDWISHAHLPRSPNCETTVSQLGDWISEI